MANCIKRDDIHKYYGFNHKVINELVISEKDTDCIISYNALSFEYRIKDTSKIVSQKKYEMYCPKTINKLNLRINHLYVENAINNNSISCIKHIIPKKTFFSYMYIDIKTVKYDTMKLILDLGYKLDEFNILNIVRHNRLDLLLDHADVKEEYRIKENFKITVLKKPNINYNYVNKDNFQLNKQKKINMYRGFNTMMIFNKNYITGLSTSPNTSFNTYFNTGIYTKII
jgi:hypothetical protein